jgi:hypothetical protein
VYEEEELKGVYSTTLKREWLGMVDDDALGVEMVEMEGERVVGEGWGMSANFLDLVVSSVNVGYDVGVHSNPSNIMFSSERMYIFANLADLSFLIAIVTQLSQYISSLQALHKERRSIFFRLFVTPRSFCLTLQQKLREVENELMALEEQGKRQRAEERKAEKETDDRECERLIQRRKVMQDQLDVSMDDFFDPMQIEIQEDGLSPSVLSDASSPLTSEMLAAASSPQSSAPLPPAPVLIAPQVFHPSLSLNNFQGQEHFHIPDQCSHVRSAGRLFLPFPLHPPSLLAPIPHGGLW